MMDITFVLPARNGSGGVRVTVDMGNSLLSRGHRVRLAYRAGRRRLWSGIRAWWRPDASDWIAGFRGRVQEYRELREIAFSRGEIVIAVGTFTIREVAALPSDVVKVRYCHGLPTDWPKAMETVWRKADWPNGVRVGLKWKGFSQGYAASVRC
jgi:hypothetical protein